MARVQKNFRGNQAADNNGSFQTPPPDPPKSSETHFKFFHHGFTRSAQFFKKEVDKKRSRSLGVQMSYVGQLGHPPGWVL